MRIHLLSLLCLCLLFNTLRAQQYQGLYFEMTDGSINTYDLWSVEKITFSNTETLLHFSGDSVSALAIADIGHYGYTMVTSAQNPVSAGFGMNIFPNPAADQVNIAYVLPEAIDLRVDVFDLQGRHITQLFAGLQTAGEYRLRWNTGEVSIKSGIYVCRLTTSAFTLNQSIFIQP